MYRGASGRANQRTMRGGSGRANARRMWGTAESNWGAVKLVRRLTHPLKVARRALAGGRRGKDEGCCRNVPKFASSTCTYETGQRARVNNCLVATECSDEPINWNAFPPQLTHAPSRPRVSEDSRCRQRRCLRSVCWHMGGNRRS